MSYNSRERCSVLRIPFHIVLFKVIPYNLMSVVGPFSPCNNGIFIKLNLPMPLVLVRQQKISQKYFELSAFN